MKEYSKKSMILYQKFKRNNQLQYLIDDLKKSTPSESIKCNFKPNWLRTTILHYKRENAIDNKVLHKVLMEEFKWGKTTADSHICIINGLIEILKDNHPELT